MKQALVSEGLGMGTQSHLSSAVAGRGPDEMAWRAWVLSPQKRSQHLGFQGLQIGKKHKRDQKNRGPGGKR